MSNYQQMSEAAEAARKGYLDYQQRIWGYFSTIMNGLTQHCGVPQDRMVWMKWNGIDGPGGHFAIADDGMRYALPGAITYDDHDNSFNLGVLIYMTPATHLPRLPVAFGLWISEKNGVPSIRVGRDGKARLVALQNEVQKNSFCEEIAREIVEAYAFPPNENQKSIGFDIGSLA